MTTDSICPICGFQGVDPGKEKCPQCDADLSCFRVLDSLPDSLPPPKVQAVPGKRTLAFAGVTLSLCVIVGLFLIWALPIDQGDSPVNIEPVYPVRIRIDMAAELERMARKRPVAEPEMEVAIFTNIPAYEPAWEEGVEGEDSDLTKTEETKGVAGESQKEPVQEKASPKEEAFWVHRATGKETLWRIAHKYYGSGFYYPVLLKHNPGIGIHDIQKDLALKILKDPAQAEQIYKKVTERRGDRFYYLYVLEKGDTFEAIAQRFYGTQTAVEQIRWLNPDVAGNPGETIRIGLQ